jgi:ABC-type Zn2+ transport system substrate-binding protein/surface adhesin
MSTDVVSVVSDDEEERMTRDNEDDNWYDDVDDENENSLFTTPSSDDDLYVLDAFRWLWQSAEGQTIDHYDDPFSDAFERWRIQMDSNCKEFENEVDQKSERVIARLEKIKAFTYEDLVKGYLFCTDDYFGGSVKYAAYDRKVTSTLHSVLHKINTTR